MGVKLAINGFGRIGRNALKAALKNKDVEVVAVNDLTDSETLAHLFKYDSLYGIYPGEVKSEPGKLIIDGREIAVLAERDPANLPWGEMGVDIVLECTGLFRDKAKASKHVQAGAKKVIISAPAKDEDITIVMGVNEDKYDPAKHQIISNASCTTNCLAPVAKVLQEKFGIIRGLMTTVHSYTNDQVILDAPHSDLRRARAGAVSIIPTTTGAAQAVALVLPELKGKMNGFALRVPTPTVSITDFVAQLEKKASVEEINKALEEAANNELKGILEVSYEPLVSADYRGNEASSIVDALSTMVVDGDFVKVVAWYDNEWGYSHRLIDLAAYIAQKGL
ncbi:MAG TPA: type I glyceraldehyde-3-phosphate dehydrogenase [Clostridia bacterium]|nr:type I glyceraldehyde-3-phosphate dehydrogenase [Clostridia bacterium]